MLDTSADETLVAHLHAVATARDVPYELLCSAVEESLGAAYRAHCGSSSAIARLDPLTGDLKLFERRVVVEAVADPLTEIGHDLAGASYEVGDYFDRRVDPGSFARVAALTAKRTILQRVLELERERVYAHYRELEGTLVTGLVQRDVAGAVYALLDERNEAAMPPWERSPRDRAIGINDRVVFELHMVRRTRRGPVLLLSRASERFVRLLIDDRAVISAARDPGRLTLLLVTRPVDVAAARTEIGGERIEQIYFGATGDDRSIVAAALPQGTEVIDLGCPAEPAPKPILAISEDPRVHERTALAGKLVGRTAIAVRPEHLDELMSQLEAEDAVAEPTPDVAADIDPELIRKLEAYAAERAELEEPE